MQFNEKRPHAIRLWGNVSEYIIINTSDRKKPRIVQNFSQNVSYALFSLAPIEDITSIPPTILNVLTINKSSILHYLKFK